MANPKKTAVKNIQELRFKLCELYASVENEEVSDDRARTLTGVADKILKSCAVELQHQQIIKTVEVIDFIDSENKYRVKRIEQKSLKDEIIQSKKV